MPLTPAPAGLLSRASQVRILPGHCRALPCAATGTNRPGVRQRHGLLTAWNDCAEQIDTSELPRGLRGGRAQVHLHAAWVYAQHMDDSAVVINLMQAERVAPQMLRYNIVAHEILRELLKRERRSPTPGLRAPATRA
jgi:hypothetical protein